MKDYKKIAEKIRKMGVFCEVRQCGYPTEKHPVNLCFQLCEAYVIGYIFYIAYDYGKWSIDYTLDPTVKVRASMQHVSGIATDREMYCRVEGIIKKIRHKCGVKPATENMER